MRATKRTRRYIASHWLFLLKPMFRYDSNRRAYILRGVGNRVGPVLRVDRRVRRKRTAEGAERRGRPSTA